MKFEVGDIVETRGGHKVLITSVREFVIAGALLNDSLTATISPLKMWHDNGHYSLKVKNEMDLIKKVCSSRGILKDEV